MSTTTDASTPSPDGRNTRWNQQRAISRRELVDATLRAIRQHGAGVGMDLKRAVTGDLTKDGAARYPQLAISGNRVR